MTARDEHTQRTLENLLREKRLFAETPLYREATRDVLGPAGTPNVFRLHSRSAEILNQAASCIPWNR